MDQYSLRGSNGVTSKEILYSANIFRIRKKNVLKNCFMIIMLYLCVS